MIVVSLIRQRPAARRRVAGRTRRLVPSLDHPALITDETAPDLTEAPTLENGSHEDVPEFFA